MPIAPARGSKARRTHETLLRATRETIARTGAFSAEAVAERAGMSPATFYSYFPSKDLALAAALDGILGDLNDAADGALDLERLLDTDLRTVLSGLASAVLDVFRDNLLVFRLALSRLPDSKEIRDVYRRRQSDGLAELRRFLELGRAAGRVRADRDLETLATAVLVTLQGFNNPILLQRRDDDPVVDALVAMLERSLRVEA